MTTRLPRIVADMEALAANVGAGQIVVFNLGMQYFSWNILS